MSLDLINIFKYLPDEIIQIIINYTDIIVYRHGKYINRTLKNNKKYLILKTIPRPIKVGFYKILLKLLNYKFENVQGYLIEYNYADNYLKINIKFAVREIDGYDRYYNIKSELLMIFDANSKWSKIVEYTM